DRAPQSYARPSPDRFAIDLAGAGTLLIAEAYHPHWRAREGSRALSVTPTDDGFMTIEIFGPGHHHVELQFEPPRWYQTLKVLSAAALLLVVITLLRERWRVRRG